MRLKTTGKNESPLENDLPLYGNNDSDNPPVLVLTVEHEEDRARGNPNIKPSFVDTEYDPPTIVEIKQAQQQNTFCRIAETQIGHHNCKFTLNQEGMLVRKAHISDAIQIL